MRSDRPTFATHILFGIDLLLAVLTQPNIIEVSNPTPVRVVRVAEATEEPPPIHKTLREVVLEMAVEEGVDWQLVDNLVQSESGWDPKNINEKTEDYGLFQINKLWANDERYPITPKEALDPFIATKWALNQIRMGNEHYWVVCSCVQYVRALGTNVPRGTNADDFIPNTTLRELRRGDVVIFEYNNGKRHVGFYDKMESGKLLIKQTNYEPCKTEEWAIDPGDPTIYGFWSYEKEMEKTRLVKTRDVQHNPL